MWQPEKMMISKGLRVLYCHLAGSVKKIQRISLYSTSGSVIEHENLGSISATRKEKKLSFSQKIFCGQFDNDFLTYPECLNDEESNNATSQAVNCQQEIKKVSSKNDILKIILKSGILNEPKQTSFLRAIELLDLDPASSVLVENQNIVIKTILKYGTKKLIDTYIPKLMSGEMIAAYAMTEKTSGSDPILIETRAVEKKNIYEINGEKIWITNAQNANIFIIFAKTGIGINTNELSAFLVPKSENIEILHQNPVGLDDCFFSQLKLTKLQVPSDHILEECGSGYKIAADSLKIHKHFLITCISNNLKKMLSDAIDHIKTREQFHRDLKDCHLVQSKISNASLTLYALESMVYLIAGMADDYDIDTSLESAFIQAYACGKGIKAIEDCISLLASKGYDKSYNYDQIHRDLLGLKLFVKTQDILNLYISLSGLEYSGDYLKNSVYKLRNPLDFPGYTFRRLFFKYSNNFKSKLQLFNNIHPSLQEEAGYLEDSIKQFFYAIECLLIRYGTESVNQQMALLRISDIAIEILAMTSILGRASRSYCTGIRHCDEEMLYAKAYCTSAYSSIKQNIDGIVESTTVSSDFITSQVGSHMFKHGKYFLEHPTVKNIK